jgi:hypothetical protein
MVEYTNVNEYINYLIDNQVNINIIEFVKEINKLKYNIDISFIDEFTSFFSLKKSWSVKVIFSLKK